jgi:hypothetical protein
MALMEDPWAKHVVVEKLVSFIIRGDDSDGFVKFRESHYGFYEPLLGELLRDSDDIDEEILLPEMTS